MILLGEKESVWHSRRPLTHTWFLKSLSVLHGHICWEDYAGCSLALLEFFLSSHICWCTPHVSGDISYKDWINIWLFGPPCSSFSTNIGKARKVLCMLIFRVSAWCQRGVHVPCRGIACWVHRSAGVAVGWGNIWPAGGHRGRMQPRSTTHQTWLHAGHRAVQWVLKKWRGGKKNNQGVCVCLCVHTAVMHFP